MVEGELGRCAGGEQAVPVQVRPPFFSFLVSLAVVLNSSFGFVTTLSASLRCVFIVLFPCLPLSPLLIDEDTDLMLPAAQLLH